MEFPLKTGRASSNIPDRGANLVISVNAESIRELFEAVQKGKLSPDDAVQRLRHLPFEDLGFAKVDHHRALRNGMPEVIFGLERPRFKSRKFSFG